MPPRLPGRGAAFAVAILATYPSIAAPKVLDRVVAAVNGRAICASDVRKRAQPMLLRVSPEQRAKAEPTIAKRILQDLIEERLVRYDADALRLGVTPEEVDRALDAVAKTNGLSRQELLDEAKKLGAEEQDYRDEIWRQILEQKWIEARVRPRVSPPSTLAEERKKRLDELRLEVVVEVVP